MKNLTILWFANTPCGAYKYLDLPNIFGGWLLSLEDELKQVESINLNIAFFYDKDLDAFEFEGVRYFPIYKPQISKRNFSIKNVFKNYFSINNNYITKARVIIDQFKPDLIHVHGTENPFGILQNYYNIPVLISMQGLLNPILEKYYSDIPSNIIKKYSSVLRRILKISMTDTYFQFQKSCKTEKEILENAKYITGRTHWDKGIVSLMNYKNCNYYHVDEILRQDFYEKNWNKINFNEPINLVTVISSPPYKGLASLAKTAALLKDKIKFNWYLVGLDKSSELISIVQKWLKINLIELNIIPLGILNSAKLSDIMVKADIFIQVSRIENSSNSLCEAALLGLPIIATNVGGTSTIVKDTEDGILVQEGEPFSLASAIIELSSNFDDAKKRAISGRKKALRRHDRSFISSSLVGIYNKIVDDRKT